jgi:hypothetical protein
MENSNRLEQFLILLSSFVSPYKFYYIRRPDKNDGASCRSASTPAALLRTIEKSKQREEPSLFQSHCDFLLSTALSFVFAFDSLYHEPQQLQEGDDAQQ